MFKKISFITLSTLFAFTLFSNQAHAQQLIPVYNAQQPIPTHSGSDCIFLRIPGYYSNTKTGEPCTPTQGQVLGAESYYFTAPMKLNSIGAEVKELQKFLNNKGYNAGGVDGQFGPMTKSAVIKFQTANNISADGVVGPATRTLLNTK